MADLLYYSNLFPQVREYALISVEELKTVIDTELPLNSETLTRSKKRAFAGWLPMLRVLLEAIQENLFVRPDWMSLYEMQMVHYPEAGIPNLPEPPTFSSDSNASILSFSDDMPTEEFEPDRFEILPLAQSTPRHQSFELPRNWSSIYASSEESSIQVSFEDTTIEESITIMMNDRIDTLIEPSSPRSFAQEVLEFSYGSAYSIHRSALMSPTSPPLEWVEETMEIDEATE
jgi:hypothetical protein